MPVHYRYSGDKEAGIAIKRTVDRELDKHLDNTRLGNLEQNRSVTTFVDGTTIECKSIFNNHLVNVFVPVRGVEKKEEKVEYETVEDWVMLLGMVDDTYTQTGVLVVDQTFTVLQFLKKCESDTSNNFDGFANWNRYYGFKFSWGNKDIGSYFEVEELERRSQFNLMDRYENASAKDITSDYEPGYPPDVFPSNTYPGISGPNLSGTYWYVDGYYIHHSSGMNDYDEYVDNTLYAFWNSAVAASDEGDFFDLFMLMNTHYYQAHIIFWWYFPYGETIETTEREGWEYESYIWPPDGIQRRSSEYSFSGRFFWYWNKDESREEIFSYDYSDATIETYEWEGCWTNLSFVSINKVATEYYNQVGTCTLLNPVDCKENTIFVPYERYIINVDHIAAVDFTKRTDGTGSPLLLTPPNMDYTEYFTGEFWFDDGTIAVICENLDYSIFFVAVDDMGIYNWGKEPVYVIAYRLEENISEGYDYLEKVQLMFYWKGELHQSDIFENTINTEDYDRGYSDTYPYQWDVFNCVDYCGSKWDGQVRAAKLRITRRKQ